MATPGIFRFVTTARLGIKPTCRVLCQTFARNSHKHAGADRRRAKPGDDLFPGLQRCLQRRRGAAGFQDQVRASQRPRALKPDSPKQKVHRKF